MTGLTGLTVWEDKRAKVTRQNNQGSRCASLVANQPWMADTI